MRNWKFLNWQQEVLHILRSFIFTYVYYMVYSCTCECLAKVCTVKIVANSAHQIEALSFFSVLLVETFILDNLTYVFVF